MTWNDRRDGNLMAALGPSAIRVVRIAWRQSCLEGQRKAAENHIERREARMVTALSFIKHCL
ncbi:hypothetical protein BJ165DRAFT_1456593 [Panaeolus papilionaceus]|nr:hypothetical protein BJ165DRAFT_1456593 [Panaeolus papilionaceus]